MNEPVLITIEDPGWHWEWWIPYGIVVGAAWVTFLLVFIASRFVSSRTAAHRFSKAMGWILSVSIAATVLSPAIAWVVGLGIYYGERDDAKMAAFEEAGYAHLNIDSSTSPDSFVASKDGKYIEGYIEDVDDTTWRVLETYIPVE